jgi:hypothetical protein
MANVPFDQNSPENIPLLRASRALYARAKRIAAIQVLLAVVIPVAGAFVALVAPSLKAYFALYGILVALLDTCVLDRLQRRTTRRAARTQEEFDSRVLDLPWDAFAVGPHPDREDIHEASGRHNKGREDSSLLDWYPVVAASVSPHFGRIICQRANLWWDSKLRKVVSVWALGVSVALAVLVAFIALSGQTTVETFVLGFLAPVSPLLFWGVREYWRQLDSAQLSDRLKGEAEKLWEDAAQGRCSPDACRAQSRLFQNGIFERRASGTPIFNWVYRLLRKGFEQQMRFAAEGWVRQVPTSTGEAPPS